jgi:VanZ family protein
VVLLLSLYVLFWPEPAGAGAGPPGADKVVHLLLFAGLAATARARFGSAPQVLVAVGVYATLSELVQALALSQRSGNLLDLVADLAGAALGWYAARRLAG